MKLNRIGKGVGAVAAFGLVLGSVVALTAQSAQALPGQATITVSDVTDLGTTQIVTVSGNAGPKSIDNNGSDPGGSADANYPNLYISMCKLIAGAPTADSCDTDVTSIPPSAAVTGDPSTDPHVRSVVPNQTTGDWGPVQFLVRKTLISGSGNFQCGTPGNDCIIGSANGPRPKDHSYDALSPVLTFAAPQINVATPGPHSNGQTVSVTGTNFPMNVLFDGGTALYMPSPKAISLFQCKLPVTGAGDCNSSDLTGAVVDKYGSFTQNVVVSDQVNTIKCGVADNCGFGSINNPPGAPDMWSVYGPATLDFPEPAHAEVVALNNRGTIYGGAQAGTATATRIGKSVAISAAAFTPNTVFDSVELCDVNGANCAASQLKGNSALTNPVSLTAASATGTKQWQTYVDTSAAVGVHTVKITQGSNVVLTQSFLVQGTPAITAPASATQNQSITVSGSNFDPGSTVGEGGANAAAQNPTVTLTVGTATKTVVPDANGAFTTTISVTDTAATSVTATSGTGPWALSATSPFTVSAFAGQINENVELNVTGGNLSMVRTDGLTTPITMDGITLNGTNQVSQGDVHGVTITDARGSSAGWTLMARLTDLTGDQGLSNSTIPASSFAWTRVCATTAGGATVTAPGAATPLSNSDQVFCQAATGQGGGIFTAASHLTVPVPATQDAGLYTGIMTLTLS